MRIVTNDIPIYLTYNHIAIDPFWLFMTRHGEFNDEINHVVSRNVEINIRDFTELLVTNIIGLLVDGGYCEHNSF